MKFNPGDPVWVMFWRPDLSITGEKPGVVVSVAYAWCGRPHWQVDMPFTGDARPGTIWTCDEKDMRPRRDDYQQHEGLGSMTKIRQPLDLTLESALEHLENCLEESRATPA